MVAPFACWYGCTSRPTWTWPSQWSGRASGRLGFSARCWTSAASSPSTLEGAIEQVVRETGADWPDLYDTLVRHSRRGRNGCGPFRAVLDERFGDQVVTDSKFEHLVRRLLKDAGVEEPESQHSIYDGDRFIAEVDLAWPDRLVGVELQSKKHHLHSTAFERDKQRLNDARLHGWNVLEYTFKFYKTRPNQLIREIQTALAQRSGVT